MGRRACRRTAAWPLRSAPGRRTWRTDSRWGRFPDLASQSPLYLVQDGGVHIRHVIRRMAGQCKVRTWCLPRNAPGPRSSPSPARPRVSAVPSSRKSPRLRISAESWPSTSSAATCPTSPGGCSTSEIRSWRTGSPTSTCSSICPPTTRSTPTPRSGAPTTCARLRRCSPPAPPPGCAASCWSPAPWCTARSPDNPVPLPEDSAVAAEPDTGVVGDHLEIEALARRSLRSHPGLDVTVLRPAAVVGPGVDSVVTRHFEAPRLLTVKGCEPRWQFCHVDDLVSALEMAALGTVSGVVAVGCEGWLEQEQVEEISGLRRLELPAGLTFGTAQRLHRLGITPAPATDLHYVVYPWVVDCAALRAAGWKPLWTNEAALRAAPGAARGQARGRRPPPVRQGRHDHRRRRRHRRRPRHRGDRPCRPQEAPPVSRRRRADGPTSEVPLRGTARLWNGSRGEFSSARLAPRGSFPRGGTLCGVDVIRLLGIRDSALSVDEVLAAVGDHAAGGHDDLRRHGARPGSRQAGHPALLLGAPERRGRAAAGGGEGRGRFPGDRAGRGAPGRRPEARRHRGHRGGRLPAPGRGVRGLPAG